MERRYSSSATRRRGTKVRLGLFESRATAATRASSASGTGGSSHMVRTDGSPSDAMRPIRRAGSDIAAARRARSGCKRRTPISSYACRYPMEIPAGRCGSAIESISWPITKASATSIRARSTEAAYGVTPTRASTTRAFRLPMAGASSMPPAAISSCTISKATVSRGLRSKRIPRRPSSPVASRTPRNRSSSSGPIPRGRKWPSMHAVNRSRCRSSRGPSFATARGAKRAAA